MTTDERAEYDRLLAGSQYKYLSEENKRRLNELGKLSVEAKTESRGYEWDIEQLKKNRNGRN